MGCPPSDEQRVMVVAELNVTVAPLAPERQDVGRRRILKGTLEGCGRRLG
jgi:hypothetical protein